MQPDNNPTPASPPTQEPANQTPSPVVTQPTPPVQNESKKKKTLMLSGIIAGAAVLLSGAGAGAYFGLVVPNKPENVLKKAIDNTSKQTKTSFDGNISVESKEADQPFAAEFKMKGQTDSESKAFQATVDSTFSGITLPLELRYVDQTGYVKVGDLTTIKNLVAGFAPESGPLVDEVSKKVSNQWIEFDKTLLKQAKADCSLDAAFTPLSEGDMKIIKDQYANNKFATVKSTSSEKGTIKYEIEIDDKKSEEYAKSLKELSIVKKLKECSGEDITEPTESSSDKTPLTLWVDKKTKTISRIALKTTPAQEAKDKMKAEIDMNFSYGKADIAKPEGSKPAMQVIGELGPLFQGVFGGLGAAGQGDSDLSQQCEEAYAAYAQSGDISAIPAECQTE